MTPEQVDLPGRVTEEMMLAVEAGFRIPIEMDLAAIICIVASLQLAMRHPDHTGPSADIVRDFVESVTQSVELSGFPAHAELIRMGNNPEFDQPREEPPDEPLVTLT